MKNLVLVGFMGSGKSAVGRLVAIELGLRFVDLDRWIEEREHSSISDIFSKKGEPAFREIESEAVRQVAGESDLVIATGGGVVTRASNLDALARGGVLVCLRIDAETALARTQGHAHRPLLTEGSDAAARIRALLKERQPLYDAVPNCVEAGGRPVHDVARDVVRIYRQSKPASFDGNA